VNKSEQLAKLKSGHYITSSTDLAASLMACGCNPLQSSPCTNTYTDKKPYRSGMPGEVLYHLEKESSTFNASTEKLAHGYNSKDANEVLDSLIEKIEDLNLKNQIKEQLPLAIMSHHRAAMGNRSIIRKWWRKVEPWVSIKRNNKMFLLPRTAKKTAKKWGIIND
tara:strand:- start:1041 stop:1535 length:495 start_codon:yes stop_codon:yes gene_type:complete